MILHKFSFGPLNTTAILFGCSETKKSAVIDPGIDSTIRLLEAIQKEDLIVEKILLTHSHWDHIAGVQALKEATGASVYVHPLDLPNLEHPGADLLRPLAPIPPSHADHLLADGQLIEAGLLQVFVLHTPGHSPGGVCFHIPSEKILFSGDTLFRGTIGNLQLPTASAPDMWPSLQKLAELPLDTRVIPGHGGETTIGREIWLRDAENLYGE